jgi:hypothetical protein
MDNNEKSNINKPNVNDHLILETILNDKQLNQLYAKRVGIYSMIMPTTVLTKDGESKMIWVDETNHPLLPTINELIENRTNQIKTFFK